MVTISITLAAFEAIAALLFGSAVVERDPDVKGENQIWLARAVVDRLKALRSAGESYSDVILRQRERAANESGDPAIGSSAKSDRTNFHKAREF